MKAHGVSWDGHLDIPRGAGAPAVHLGHDEGVVAGEEQGHQAGAQRRHHDLRVPAQGAQDEGRREGRARDGHVHTCSPHMCIDICFCARLTTF